jgi:flagellar assembly protein FliH
MSPRMQRCALDQPVEPFEWAGAATRKSSERPRGPAVSASTMVDDSPAASYPVADYAPHPVPGLAARLLPDVAAIEREAFAKGFAQGEGAGNEAAAARGEAMLRRLALTIDEMAVLRADMIQKAERQLVQLALAIARRITLRELTIDRTLLSAMARVALDRLGETSSATIRLHPDDYRAITPPGQADATTGSLRVVADPAIAPGGCVVQSDLGLIDVGLDAQLTEIGGALLGGGTDGLGEAVSVAA